MINSSKEKKRYRFLEPEEMDYFIIKTSKKNFNYKDWMKSEEDWWRLANFCLELCDWNMTPRKIRNQLLNITGNNTTLRKEIIRVFFSKFDDGRYWSRGARQSFTYKYNRVYEIITDFCSAELSAPREKRYYRELCRDSYKIGSIWSGVSNYGGMIDSGMVGIVEALTEEEALLQLKMFVYPLIGHNPKHAATSNEVISVNWLGYISDNQKMDAFVLYNGQMIEARKKLIIDHREKIEKLDKKINNNKLIIETARSNLLANICSSPGDENI